MKVAATIFILGLSQVLSLQIDIDVHLAKQDDSFHETLDLQEVQEDAKKQTKPAPKPSGCKDKIAKCADYFKHGYKCSNKNFVYHCRNFCNKCHSEPQSGCPDKAGRATCLKYLNYYDCNHAGMAHHCASTCHKCPAKKKSKKPHLILLEVDDLGWNDVAFHGSEEIPTPHIDKLAKEGTILNNYYVLPVCTPSRSSLMTGQYPITIGMQDGVIEHENPWGLGVDQKTIADYLRDEGYTNHMIGKWHLGMYANELTPCYRGFDTYYGLYLGMGDMWNHSSPEDIPNLRNWGLDLHRDKKDKNGFVSKDVWDKMGKYATDDFTDEAEHIIEAHDESTPLFLYFSEQANHVSYPNDPLQAPESYKKKMSHIKHPGRRNFAAMMNNLDDNIGRVVAALKKKGIYDNSIILFTTDNGGAANECWGNWASNHPLRGTKASVFQGGVRGVGLVHSPLFDDSTKGKISEEMVHMSDWMPTFVGFAGGKAPTDIDGNDLSATFMHGKASPRKEVLLNIDTSYFKHKGLVSGDFKLIKDGPTAIKMGGWYPPPNLTPEAEAKLTVKCGRKLPTEMPSDICVKDYCLFDLKNDPCETTNIKDKYPDIFEKMKAKLDVYAKKQAKPRITYFKDPQADPRLHGNSWKPWREL